MTGITGDEPDTALSFAARLKEIADAVDAVLEDVLPAATGPEEQLCAAMSHGVLGGGKRVRPFLVIETGAVLGAREERCLRVGAAVECIHAYSLIHDDLPALDNDLERRGLPTVHAKYGQACAILAGDALLTLAFAVLADEATHSDASVRSALVAATARAAGAHGMVGGQMIDIQDSSALAQDTPVLIRMARMKTGALIELCCELAVILAGAQSGEKQALAGFTRDLGLAYQIFDDMDDARLGREVGFVAALGLDEASRRACMLAAQARQHLAMFGPGAAMLCALVDHIEQQGLARCP